MLSVDFGGEGRGHARIRIANEGTRSITISAVELRAEGPLGACTFQFPTTADTVVLAPGGPYQLNLPHGDEIWPVAGERWSLRVRVENATPMWLTSCDSGHSLDCLPMPDVELPHQPPKGSYRQ